MPGQYYSQTGKTVNTRNISGMLLSCKRKANQAWENYIYSKQECYFVASLYVLIFAVIQVFTVFPVAM